MTSPNTDSVRNLFLGIPYAEPPVGALRWKAPIKKAPWGARGRDASRYGPDCAQLGPAWPSLGPLNNSATSLGITSEDCLTLNVFTPRAAAAQAVGQIGRPILLPVVVFIPAGAMEWGSARDAENNGSAIGVGPGWKHTILVTLNYRLGVMGFLFSKGLRHQRGPGAGLYGILDQQLALRWVQNNIENFGG